jgi:hypothetical protein
MSISDISHDNLVKLYGYCVDGDERILVYNYHENNSLAHTLLGMSCFFWKQEGGSPTDYIYCHGYLNALYQFS